MEMKKIIAIDDNEDNLLALDALLQAYLPDLIVLTALSGKEGIEIIHREQPDVVLLDIIMPEMDGFQVCEELRATKATENIPIIMITAIRTDAASRVKALKVGADAFLSKPIEPEELIAQIQVMFRMKEAEGSLRKQNRSLEQQISERTKNLQITNEELQLSQKNLILTAEQLRSEIREREEATIALESTMNASVKAISRVTEYRDPYTAGHQRKVRQLSVAIAKHMGLSEQKLRCIMISAELHDIGKIAVPVQILTKPTRLTAAEYKLIQTHSQVGYNILQDLQFFCPIADIVLQHHERINGSGYPNGLQREDIHQEAIIIGISDVVEAMASNRPYRPALGVDKALGEIKRGRGDIYDEEVADACLDLFATNGFIFEN